MNLDSMILFSSITRVFGSIGQSDYSAANVFMDEYARYRNRLAKRGERRGRTISMNWPLWEEGGMSMDEDTKKIMMKNTGMIPMKTEIGIHALYKGLASGNEQVMVLEGDIKKIQVGMMSKAESNPVKEQSRKQTEKVNVDKEILREKTLHRLKALLGELTKLSINKIETEESLDAYGIDSIMIAQLNQKLAYHFKELSKTIFYEYQTLRALGEYLISDYLQECIKWTEFEEQRGVSNSKNKVTEHELKDNTVYPMLTSIRRRRESLKRNFAITGIHKKTNEPIAIIGMTGRYPKANDLKEYWHNLREGKDCISAIPGERWPLEGFYHGEKEEAIAQGEKLQQMGRISGRICKF